MTEQEWFDYKHVMYLLGVVQDRCGERKLRLFALACCRRVEHLMPDDRSRQALQFLEQWVDGSPRVRPPRGRPAAENNARAATEEAEEVADATIDPADYLARLAERKAAWAAHYAILTRARYATNQAAGSACMAMAYSLCEVPPSRISNPPDLSQKMDEEQAVQVKLLHDIVGNPFHPPTVDPAWLTWNDGTIPKLAQAMYENRSFTPEQMGILGDALEEAGCTDFDILHHCRQPEGHVLGCWVVDAMRGKS